MPSVAGWWAGRSDPQRIALYTRWSYYSVLAVTPLFGLLVPLSGFPEPVAEASRFLPLTPVIELSRLGLVGETWSGHAVDTAGAWAAAPVPLAVLAAWLVVGAVVARRVFRWAPRR